MRVKFLRWLIRKILPGYCLSRIGKRAKKERQDATVQEMP